MKNTISMLSAVLLLVGGWAAPTTAETDTTSAAAKAAMARVRAVADARPEGIPARPEKLDFPDLEWSPPSPDGLRHELSNGIPVYVVEDHDLPLVDVVALFHGGNYLDPEGSEGLAQLVDQSWRSGGAGEMDAKTFDEELDFLAANLRAGSGSTSGSVSLDVLSRNLDRGLELMMDLMTEPRFQADRLEKARTDMLQSMKQRNDSTTGIEAREWSRLLYGEGHWLNRLSTGASVENLDGEDCKAFVARLIGAGNMVLAVSGDVDTAAVLAKLEKSFGQLPKIGPVPAPTAEATSAAPGVYGVHKEDVNQGRVSIGLLTPMEGHPDEFSLRLMNEVLGGGGFTSWITQRVRSDEGLAYSAGSSLSFPNDRPGTFRALYQSKSPTVSAAADIVYQQFQRIRSEAVSAEKLATAKAAFIDTFPNRFQSSGQTALTFARDELDGRDHSYWATYRDNIAAVTSADIIAAAKKHLVPENMVMLVVGNLDEIAQGSPDYEASLSQFGELTRVPLRDPLTLEPLE